MTTFCLLFLLSVPTGLFIGATFWLRKVKTPVVKSGHHVEPSVPWPRSSFEETLRAAGKRRPTNSEIERSRELLGKTLRRMK